ncbi:hypothetical protein ACFOD0_13935 [Shewanella intestini]|uniref:Uncharacterized protein n=1 Tax=Shewanella intestini TaxID=2017544 RepID=A0ABS5I2P6_9GAMM|nr:MULTISPECIES: hypothetical protein [Shewanella]MBR9728296.1 hypothetical protein [Shewanella intestini]MRG35761.1 hypothetical protein [Shewanella sp. XMDDZSB0408]
MNKQSSNNHFHDLFYFIDSNDQNTVNWIKHYVKKQGYNVDNLGDIYCILNYLAGLIPFLEQRYFSDKMKWAYRTHKSRKKKKSTQMLNVIIDKNLINSIDKEREIYNLSRSKFVEVNLNGTFKDERYLEAQKQIKNEHSRVIQQKESIDNLKQRLNTANSSLEEVQETLSMFYETIKQRAVLDKEYDKLELCELQTLYQNAMNIKKA